jgi:hypothetical protein
MKFVYVLDASPWAQPRTQTILRWLDDHQIDHAYLKPRRKITSNRLFKKMLPKVAEDYFRGSILDGFAFALSALPSITRKALIERKKVVVVVAFHSWGLFPFVPLFRLFPSATVVVDYGYPADDISTVSLPDDFKDNITSLERLLDRRGLYLLLESDQQRERVRTLQHRPNLLTCFVLESTGLSAQPPRENFRAGHHFPESADPKSPYLLFRGALNEESGILDVIRRFSTFVEGTPAFPFQLIVHGGGRYQKEVEQLSQGAKSIHHFNAYLDREDLTGLMQGAAGMIGQFNVSSPRLRLTVPHKFIESLVLQRLYMTPSHPPVRDYLQSLLEPDLLRRIERATDPFMEWLSILNEDPSLCTSAKLHEVSSEVLSQMKRVNDRSLGALVAQ